MNNENRKMGIIFWVFKLNSRFSKNSVQSRIHESRGEGGVRIFFPPVYAESKHIKINLTRLMKMGEYRFTGALFKFFLAVFGTGFLINQQSQRKTENTIEISVVSSLNFFKFISIGLFSIEKMRFFSADDTPRPTGRP
jgi:hypothetical protein